MKEILKKVQAFFGEVVAEGHKITWPTRQELWGSTWVVLAFIVILAVTTLLCDKVIQKFIALVHTGV